MTNGYALANVDSVKIDVKGVGGHGAYPQNTKDPIVLASRIVMADGKSVTAEDLDLPGSSDAAEEELALNLRAARETADRRAIRLALSRTENNISGAAKLLGISRPTLYDLLKQYQLSA